MGLGQGLAAVHRQRLPRHPRRQRRGEERHRVRDVIRGPEAVHGDGFDLDITIKEDGTI